MKRFSSTPYRTKEQIEARVLADYAAVVGKVIEVGTSSESDQTNAFAGQFSFARRQYRVQKLPPRAIVQWSGDWCDPQWPLEAIGEEDSDGVCRMFAPSYQMTTGNCESTFYRIIDTPSRWALILAAFRRFNVRLRPAAAA